MGKVIVIQGCKDCPYLGNDSFETEHWFCTKFGHFVTDLDKVPDIELLPETPHPNCKLNDLPSQEYVKSFVIDRGITTRDKLNIELGANHVIKEITK
jgi:hypothetical protein